MPLTKQQKRLDVQQLFSEMDWARDLCEDAQMTDVLQYLYGNRALSLPAEWKCLFPASL